MQNALIQTKIFEGPQAETRLCALGMDTATLRTVLLTGEYARAEATEHDPIAAGALDAYRYRVRAFRDLYVPRGWTVDREGGVEMTRSPCRHRVVITRAGNEAVGLKGVQPQPKRPAGSGTRGVVGDGLLLNPDWLNTLPESGPEGETWMLLVCREADTVRAELSWPTGISEDGDVLGWFERILLPTIDLSEPHNLRQPSTVGPEDAIDVPVIRKR